MPGVPAFGTWGYNYPCLPEAFHGSRTQIQSCLDWLISRPHCNAVGRYLGRSHGEAVALVIGLLVQDMYKAQFSQDPDEDVNQSVPHFILSSKLDFSTIDEILLPLCEAITTCVRQAANDRSTLDSSLFPYVEDGIMPSPKVVMPTQVVKGKKIRLADEEEREPAKKKSKMVPGKKRPALIQPIEASDEGSEPARRKGKMARIVESDDEPHTPEPAKRKVKIVPGKKRPALVKPNLPSDDDPHTPTSAPDEPAKKKGKRVAQRKVPAPVKDTGDSSDEPHTPTSVREGLDMKKGKTTTDAPSRTQPKRANKDITWTKTPSGLKKVKGRTE